MLFNSFEFLLFFLPATIAAYYVCRRAGWLRASVATLAAASLFFYAWWDWRNLPLLLVSVVFNFWMGRWIAQAENHRGPLLAAAVAGNLLALGFFKYWNFIVANVAAATGAALPVSAIALPLGISFFTFTQIAFLVDTSRGLAREYRLLEYVLFVSYFPHLIAGPIIHHKQLIPQFARRFPWRRVLDDVALGMLVFVFGLAKKVLIADNLAEFANPVFAAAAEGRNIDPLSAWLGVTAYATQLYFDFSGYSDMAVGLSKMFGINLPINFNTPYAATSLIDFWRRWHMTLSRFLRDYLYLPLGGNRRGSARRYVNLLVTMVLGGFWHGAGWTFIVWGAIHGVALAGNHLWRSVAPAWWKKAPKRVRNAIGGALTLLVVLIAWVYFRAADLAAANRLLGAMFTISSDTLDAVLAVVRSGARALLSRLRSDWMFVLAVPAGPSPPSFGILPTVAGLALVPLALAISIVGPNALALACAIRRACGGALRMRSLVGYAAVAASALVFFLCLARLNKASEFLYFQF